jgi:hypothetical protein
MMGQNRFDSYKARDAGPHDSPQRSLMRICLLSIATTLCASGPARKLRDAAAGHST